MVRKHLLPESYKLTQLPVKLLGVVRHFTPEEAAPVRAIDPLLFQGLNPETGNYLWYSVQVSRSHPIPLHSYLTDLSQECIDEPDGRKSIDSLVIISWIIKDEVKDAIPKTHAERIALMKKRVEGYAEPLRSIVMDIPDDLPSTTAIRFADFPCVEWDNQGGKVTLAGDSAHAMTMFVPFLVPNHTFPDRVMPGIAAKAQITGFSTQHCWLIS